MAFATLASHLSPLLFQTPPGGEDGLAAEILTRLIIFPLIAGAIFLFGAAYIAFLTLFFGAFAVPPVSGIRWLYGRAVLRSMNNPGGSAPAARADAGDEPGPARVTSKLAIDIQEPGEPGAEEASPLSRRAVEASGAGARVYVAAASACAVVLTPMAVHVALSFGDDLRDFPPAFFYLSTFVVLMWLPVLVFLVTAVGRRWLKRWAVVSYSLLLAAPILFLPGEVATSTFMLLVISWAVLVAPSTSTLLVLRFSGVGGLALGMILSLSVPVLALAFKAVYATLAGTETQGHGGASESIGLYDLLFLASFVFVLVGPLVAAVAAAALLWWMSNRYARKQTSEQLLHLDIFWMVAILVVSLVSYYCEAGWLTLLGPLSFAAYKLVVRAGLRRLRPAEGGGRPEPRLLLLRVFGAKRRSEWLLKRLGYYWLYSGSIQLIAAPDLAGATLDLDEMFDFLRGRLENRFVKDGEDCRRRVGSLDVRPDPDGRYRVNEFFCHDDVWFRTVGELTEQTDAVLMDLRGFTRANQGCIKELHHLVDAVPVNRLVLLVNEQTDTDFLRRTFEDAWAEMGARSPNRDLASPVLRVLDIRRQNSRAVRRLLSMLYAAAEAPRPAAKS